MIGLDDSGGKVDDCPGVGGIFTVAVRLAHGELAEGIFVNSPEGIVIQRGEDFGEFLELFLEQGAGEVHVGPGQLGRSRPHPGPLTSRGGEGENARGDIELRADALGFMAEAHRFTLFHAGENLAKGVPELSQGR